MQATLTEKLKPLEPHYTHFLDLCDHLEAKDIAYPDRLDPLDKGRLAQFMNAVRHPDLDSDANLVFDGLVGEKALFQHGAQLLMISSRLTADANDVFDSMGVEMNAQESLAQHHFSGFRDVVASRAADNNMGTSEAISMMRLGYQEPGEADRGSDKFRQEFFASFAYSLSEQIGSEAPEGNAFFDPRQVVIADGPNETVNVYYGSTPIMTDMDANDCRGEETRLYREARDIFYEGKEGLAPLNESSPEALSGSVKSTLLAALEDIDQYDAVTQDSIKAKADHFFAFIGDASLMPSNQAKQAVMPSAGTYTTQPSPSA